MTIYCYDATRGQAFPYELFQCPPGTTPLGQAIGAAMQGNPTAGYGVTPNTVSQGAQAAQQLPATVAGAVSNSVLGGLPAALTDATTWKRVGLLGAAVLLGLVGLVLWVAHGAGRVSTSTGAAIA